jgi:uncharacterized membrane protein YidH (DUF202 family)
MTSKRFIMIAAGVLFILLGYVRLEQGISVVRNHYGLPVFSAAVIATGVLFILLALIPQRLIARLAAGKKRQWWHR